MPQRCLLLDLDGTLVDSVPDLAAALNRRLAARGLPPFDRDAVTRMVGDGSRVLVERALAVHGIAATDADVDAYVADYTANAAVATRPYPGVAEGLAALRADGWRLAVCTNKPVRAAHAVLAALGLDAMFAAVGGGDSFPVRKPAPAHVLATLAAAGGAVGHAVMVGDHHNDIAAARGGGLPSIFAAWGYGTPDMAAGSDATAAAFADVIPLAARLVPAAR